MKKPLITVITVCYNAEKTIIETINSVLNQTYDNIEYVIVDGGSKDKTIESIKSYIGKFENKGIKISWKSEKDKGIQDAYNKAMKMATGEWFVFINSGDRLYTLEALKNFVVKIGDRDVDVVYGDIMLVDVHTGTITRRSYKDNIDLKFFMRTTICHQTIFFKKKMFELHGEYALEYKIAADFDRLLVFFLKGGKYYHIDEVIAVFVNDGVSSLNYKNTYLERIEIIKARMGKISLYYYIFHLLFILKTYILNLWRIILHKS